MRALIAAACLGLAACAPQAPPTAAPPETTPAPAEAVSAARNGEGPPTVDGLYVAKDACPGEGCYLAGRIRAREAADLFERPGPGAAVIGKVAAGEWVEIVSREAHVAPLRGLVRRGGSQFAVGDVVYLLTSQGEGCFDVWSRGAISSWCDPAAAGDPSIEAEITLDPAPPRPDGAGLWIEVKREAGATGWLHGADGFACTGYQDRDEACPPLPP